MSSPRRNTLSGACVGAPCMNSGSATVIFSSGICLRRVAHVDLELGKTALALVLLAGLDAQRRLERAALEADRGEDLPDFRHLPSPLSRPRLDVGHRLLESGAGRHFDVHREFAAIFLRHELGADHRQRRHARKEHHCRGGDDLPRMRDAPIPAGGDSGDRCDRRSRRRARGTGRCGCACAPRAG